MAATQKFLSAMKQHVKEKIASQVLSLMVFFVIKELDQYYIFAS